MLTTRWVFKRSDMWSPMKMHKIGGLTTDGVFIIHGCKELECAPNKIHRNQLMRGIFESAAGELYSHFMYLKGHKCNTQTKAVMVFETGGSPGWVDGVRGGRQEEDDRRHGGPASRGLPLCTCTAPRTTRRTLRT